MLQSVKQLYGNLLEASDGDIGQVRDLYFDDHGWAVRYVVADAGTWLTNRQVLLSPHAFSRLHQAGKVLCVNLTRKQIENSPSIDLHKPVSRQKEEEYHRHYGWPHYWEGDGLWGGMRGFPVLELPADFSPAKPVTPASPAIKYEDAHLRSTKAVNGYHLQATDGIAGHICDFMMDDRSWAITELVIKIGNRFTGKEVRIPTSKVDLISYDESKVFVSMTTEAVEQSFAPNRVPFRVAGFTPPPNNQSADKTI